MATYSTRTYASPLATMGGTHVSTTDVSTLAHDACAPQGSDALAVCWTPLYSTDPNAAPCRVCSEPVTGRA